MESKQKFYWLWGAIGLLLCLNLATVGWVIRRVAVTRASQQDPGGFTAKRLGLTKAQLGPYRESRIQLQRGLKPHQDSVRLLRNELLEKISQPAVSDAQLDTLLAAIARQNQAINRLRFRHWQSIRALCTPEQRARFDKLTARLEQALTNPASPAQRRQQLQN